VAHEGTALDEAPTEAEVPAEEAAMADETAEAAGSAVEEPSGEANVTAAQGEAAQGEGFPFEG
jgi:hypothetical protein